MVGVVIGRADETAAAPGRRSPSLSNVGRVGRDWQDVLLIGALVGLALLGTIGGQGAAVRLAYPAGAVLIAGQLFLTGQRAAYVTFCIWLFAVTPGVRRYVDLSAGFMAVNTLMLAPWLASVFSLTVIPRALRGPPFPLYGGILIVTATASYGLALAALDERIVAGAFDWLRWVVPPCFGALAWFTAQRDPGFQDRLLRCLTLSAALLGGYGIWQFVTMPRWDAFWMMNIDMTTIGFPEPYLVRVFSLLNSPGSLGNYLVVAMIYLFVFASPARIGALVLAIVTLLLSLNRSAWGAIAVTVVFLVVTGPVKTKLRAALAIACVALMLPLALSVPQIASAIEARYESITNLSGDESARDRLDGYAAFWRTFEENAMGQGLAATGAVEANLTGHAAVLVDGQVLEVYGPLGLLAGTLYLVASFYCIGQAFFAGWRANNNVGLASSAVAMAALLLIPYGSPLVGEGGILIWLGLALCFAQPHAEIQ